MPDAVVGVFAVSWQEGGYCNECHSVGEERVLELVGRMLQLE